MKRLTVLLLLLTITIPSHAWNGTGHRSIAIVAYWHLTPATRARVDALLAQHPDYPNWVTGISDSNRGLVAFAEASVWPDVIRDDPRFHADNGRPTPNIPGLPPGSQARHATWHYMNIPFSADGTPTIPTEEPNILTKLRDFEGLGTMPDSMKVYVLPWLLHLIGDAHQPLHTMARFDRFRPAGDRGGNAVELRNGGNLHSYWDSRLGSGNAERFLTELAATLQSRYPKPPTLNMNVEQWALEGFELRTEVYAISGEGTSSRPATYTDDYAVNARETSYARAALAGYRLAEFLNQRLH